MPVDGGHDAPVDDVDALFQRTDADREGQRIAWNGFGAIHVIGGAGRIEHADGRERHFGAFEERELDLAGRVAESHAFAGLRRSKPGVRGNPAGTPSCYGRGEGGKDEDTAEQVRRPSDPFAPRARWWRQARSRRSPARRPRVCARSTRRTW